MAGSSEQELAIRIAGRVENSLKQSLGMTESGINHLVGMAKKAAVMITGAFAVIKVGQFIGDAISEYSEFEQAMANTAGISEANAEEYEKLSSAAREAGKATTFTASEAADALGYMALAGWDVETSTKALTPVLKLAEATQADLATTSDQVTDSMSAMGVGIDELQEYLDVIVMTNNKANTSSSDLMDAFIGCGGAARASGMDFKETATALGILANNGIKGSEAGTALNSMLVRISTKDAAQAAFKELGVAVYDSSGAMRNMQDILIDLNGAMAGMTEEQKNNYMAAIAGTNYYSQFGYLLDSVKEGVDGTASAWNSLSENLDNSSGALDKMDATVTNTLKGAISRFKSAISDLKISMIEAFGPYAIKIMDGFSGTVPKITENFAKMIKKLPIDDFMTGVGNMSAGVMKFLVALTDGEADINSFSSMMFESFGIELPDTVRNAISVVQDFISKGHEVDAFLRNTLVSAIGNIKKKIEANEPAFQSVIALANDLKDRLFEAFDNAKPTITFITETAIPEIVDVLLKVIGGAADVADAFVKWDGFLPTITTIGAAVAAIKLYHLVTGIYSAVRAMALLKIEKIQDIALTIKSNILQAKDIALRLANTVQTNAMAAAQWIWNGAAKVGTVVTGALSKAFLFLVSPLGLALIAIAAVIGIGILLYKNWDLIKEKAAQLKEWIGEKFNAIKEAVGEKVEAMKEAAVAAWNGIKTAAFDTWNNITETIGNALQAAKGVVDEKLSSIKATYEAHGGGIQGTAAVVMEGVKGIFSAGFSFLDTLTGGELSNISSLFSNILGTVQSTVGNILEGVKNAFQEKLETAKSIVSDAVDRIKGFFNFKWELPKLKLPHFSITGSFNITPPSVPKFNVEWYKEGGIMTRPTVFGINGSNAMIGGEAGAEAILPLSELWDNLRDFISTAINGSQDTSFAKLSDDVDKVSTINIDQEKENSGFNITYSPVYRFEGATPDKADIVQAERISQTEFDKMMRQWQKDKNRIKF